MIVLPTMGDVMLKIENGPFLGIGTFKKNSNALSLISNRIHFIQHPSALKHIKEEELSPNVTSIVLPTPLSMRTVNNYVLWLKKYDLFSDKYEIMFYMLYTIVRRAGDAIGLQTSVAVVYDNTCVLLKIGSIQEIRHVIYLHIGSMYDLDAKHTEDFEVPYTPSLFAHVWDSWKAEQHEVERLQISREVQSAKERTKKLLIEQEKVVSEIEKLADEQSALMDNIIPKMTRVQDKHWKILRSDVNLSDNIQVLSTQSKHINDSIDNCVSALSDVFHE